MAINGLDLRWNTTLTTSKGWDALKTKPRGVATGTASGHRHLSPGQKILDHHPLSECISRGPIHSALQGLGMLSNHLIAGGSVTIIMLLSYAYIGTDTYIVSLSIVRRKPRSRDPQRRITAPSHKVGTRDEKEPDSSATALGNASLAFTLSSYYPYRYLQQYIHDAHVRLAWQFSL